MRQANRGAVIDFVAALDSVGVSQKASGQSTVNSQDSNFDEGASTQHQSILNKAGSVCKPTVGDLLATTSVSCSSENEMMR